MVTRFVGVAEQDLQDILKNRDSTNTTKKDYIVINSIITIKPIKYC